MSNKLAWLDAVLAIQAGVPRTRLNCLIAFILFTWLDRVWTAFWLLLYITWFHDIHMNIWKIVFRVITSKGKPTKEKADTSVNSSDL